MEKSYKIISIIMIIIMVSVLVGYREYEVEYGTRHPNPPPTKNFYNTSGLTLVSNNNFNSGTSHTIKFNMSANDTTFELETWNNGTANVNAQIFNPHGSLYDLCTVYTGRSLTEYKNYGGFLTGTWHIDTSSTDPFNITVQIYLNA